MTMPDDNYLVPPSVRRRIAERLATAPHAAASPVEREVFNPQRPAFDAEGASRDELVAEAALRGVTVTRADGREDLEPKVEDYRAALAEAP
jgi:hypothetical protein